MAELVADFADTLRRAAAEPDAPADLWRADAAGRPARSRPPCGFL